MCKKGYFSFNTIGRYASEDLSNGDIAMFSGSCVNDQYIQIANGELGMAPLPRAIGDNTFYTGWNRGPIFLMQSEEVNRGAYEFIKFFLKPENNAQWAMSNSALSPYGTTQQLPSYQEYLDNLPETKALPYVQANLDISGSFPNVTGSAAVRRYLEEYLNNVVDGSLNINGLAEGTLVQIFDGSGKQVVATYDTTINVSSLKSGMYILKAGNQIVKFVKQ